MIKYKSYYTILDELQETMQARPKNVTLTDLSKVFGVTPRALSSIATGKRSPTTHMLLRMCDYYQLDMRET